MITGIEEEELGVPLMDSFPSNWGISVNNEDTIEESLPSS